jgi:hypothetical protein
VRNRIGAIAPSVLAVMTVPRAASAITRIVADHWHLRGRYSDARLY